MVSTMAQRVTTPPVIDGDLSDPAWKEAEPGGGLTQVHPDTGAPASERTVFRIVYDDDNLYFGVICFDSQPENIVITQNRRDADLEDTDAIMIQLDTFNDDQNAFVFAASVLSSSIECSHGSVKKS